MLTTTKYASNHDTASIKSYMTGKILRYKFGIFHMHIFIIHDALNVSINNNVM